VNDKIRIKRGIKVNLPNLDVAEFGFCVDSHETFIGSDIGNIQLAKITDIPTGGISTPSRIYEIELSRWGITQGLPTKPYSNANYTISNNNIIGINNALQWAKDNNYNYVIFPRGQYSICYPNPILTQGNMTIDFNFSTFKVMYDSVNRSPFDITGGLVHLFGGDSILCTTPYTHIVNLTLIGDRIDRSWLSATLEGATGERAMEGSNGVKFGAGADYSSIRNCNISYFMGDAIALYFAPYSNIEIGQMEFGELNTTNGITQTSTDTKRIRSMISIAIPSDMNSMSLIGIGYSSETSIPSMQYDIFFYKSDGTFINSKLNARTRDEIIFPVGTAKIKLSWVGDGTVDQGLYPDNPPYWALILKNGIANNITVEYNEIHRCHRGGLFLGTNNTIIRKNYFHDTGVPDGEDVDNLPTFNDGTRYAISTEDNIAQNNKIQDNVFDNVRLAITLRGEWNEITGNEFRNCPVGVQLYHLRNCLIDRNYFYYSSIDNFGFDNYDRNWSITNNIFKHSSIGISGNGGSYTTCAGNYFFDNSFYNVTVPALSFKNNTFDNSSFVWQNNFTTVDGCTFINNGWINIASQTKPIDQIIRCKFINGGYVRGQNSVQVIIRDSYFKESGFQYSTGQCIYTLNNCKVDNTTRAVIDNPLAADVGTVSHTLEVKNSVINIGGQKPLINSYNWGSVTIQDSIINYTLTSNYTKALLDTYGNITSKVDIRNTTITSTGGTASQSVANATTIILNDNTFTNFSLTGATVEITSNKMTSPPTKGIWKVGDIVYNSTPTIGGVLGWVCIITGTDSAAIFKGFGTISN
jgi:hypothetical protein